MGLERRGRVIAVELGPIGFAGRSPPFSGRRQPSCGGTSRMMREYHVRFRERLGVKFPGPARQSPGNRVWRNSQGTHFPIPVRHETVLAPLPKGVTSHFGPELKRFVLSQYHQGQVTVPRLAALLARVGIDISKRRIVRLLSAKQDAFPPPESVFA
jgi:hypothetical protein